jgi:restriction system protein
MSLNTIIKGFSGELRSRLAQDFFLDDKEYHSFNNVIIETTNGSTQIDHIIVSKYGIFVVETKNKNGWIFGGRDWKRWTQVIFSNKYQFQNPLLQNYKHTKSLAELLRLEESKIHSVIVFWGDCTFKTQMPENVLNNEYTPYIKSKKQVLLSDYEVNNFATMLSILKKHTPVFSGLQHVNDLKKRYASTKICPKCGGMLVEKTARITNEKFLGCQKYPYCHYTKRIE